MKKNEGVILNEINESGMLAGNEAANTICRYTGLFYSGGDMSYFVWNKRGVPRRVYITTKDENMRVKILRRFYQEKRKKKKT